MKSMKKLMAITTVALISALAAGCGGELSESSSPIELVASNTQVLNRIDITGLGAACEQTIATVQLRAIAKNTTVTGPFTDVRINRYRVSYQRTDGGTQVPAPFTRTIDTTLSVGAAASSLSNFLAFQDGAFTQAPFAALFPNNGNRDPETGRNIIRMNLILELFGETLGGERVYDSTQVPLDFCHGCGCA